MGILTFLLSVASFLVCTYLSFFVLWRKNESEHIPDLQPFLDRAVVSFVGGALTGRVAFVLLSLPQGIRPGSILDFFWGPISLPIALLFGLTFLYLLTKADWKDRFILLDFTSIALSFWFASLAIRSVFLGVIGLSIRTSEIQVAVIPLLFSFFSFVFYALLFSALNYLEKRYRTFMWYRSRRSSAQSGFVISVFLILSSVWQLAIAALSGQLTSSVVQIATTLLTIFFFVSGFLLLYIRSGRFKGK